MADGSVVARTEEFKQGLASIRWAKPKRGIAARVRVTTEKQELAFSTVGTRAVARAVVPTLRVEGEIDIEVDLKWLLKSSRTLDAGGVFLTQDEGGLQIHNPATRKELRLAGGSMGE